MCAGYKKSTLKTPLPPLIWSPAERDYVCIPGATKEYVRHLSDHARIQEFSSGGGGGRGPGQSD